MGYYRTLLIVIPNNADHDKEHLAAIEQRLRAAFDRYHRGYTLARAEPETGYVVTFTETVKWLSSDLRDELDDIDWPLGTGMWVIGEQGEDYTVTLFCGPRREVVLTPTKLAVWDPVTREALIDGAYSWMNEPPSLTIQEPPTIAPERAVEAVDLLRALKQKMVDDELPLVGVGRDSEAYWRQESLLEDVIELLRPIARQRDAVDRGSS